MGAALLLQTLAAPLGAALLSWRWPRLGYLWGALALWLVGCLLGGVYGVPVKAWPWLPLALLVPAIATQLADKRAALLLFAGLGALVWWQGLASVLTSEPRIWLALLPAIVWVGWTDLRGDSREGLGFALGFIWLALVIGIDGSLLIAQLALALAFMQMLAWQYVEVPLTVLLPVWLLPLLEWALRNKPWLQRWLVLILLAGAGTGLSLWKVWPEASLY
ncbi:hypothetical protein FGF01_04435 [Aeromonas salmonicida subsp. achromogenes]|uniref:hypothetical protein n=1 Tax=Aeromonas salmonicida TaxID=645 RepID=UPI0003000BE3|nr:hypothetical protein [Aeromonas salmonicida]TMX12801.1 hypothetical protein FGF01_04435 [Aeromonas salmonicida subsp. achromogenes]TMX15034.1 hypothetical protein FGE99_07145 [Aeromonas salmonicida subsp. achromogenes]TMX16775.1 hypothetical protein FGF02_04010 [Aeromonas salmonicida subsp. achromogenes]TMX20784.1 hypothetical protein FGF00_04265 [Aeromonas salmonicida subsp. achromogenes]